MPTRLALATCWPYSMLNCEPAAFRSGDSTSSPSVDLRRHYNYGDMYTSSADEYCLQKGIPKVEKNEFQQWRCCNQKVWAIVLMVAGSLTISIRFGTALPAFINSVVEDQVVRCSDDEPSTTLTTMLILARAFQSTGCSSSASSFLEAVQMTNTNGTVMTADSMYDSEGNLLESVPSAYSTFVDIKSGTGQTISARKRLQVSYALAASMSMPNAFMSDVLWPGLPTEVVLSTYWLEEASGANDSVLGTFKRTLALVKTFLVGLIVLVIVGIFEVHGGVFLWRR